MELKIVVEKRHVVYIILSFFVAVGMNYAIAQTYSAPNPGHSANEIGEGTIAGTLTISGGKVGIGTTSPTAPLDVENNNGYGYAAQFSKGSSYAKVGIGTTENDIGFIQGLSSSGTGRNIAIQPYAGNVGIGTASPQAKLDVNGDVNTNGVYKKDGTSGISGTFRAERCDTCQMCTIKVDGGIITSWTCSSISCDACR